MIAGRTILTAVAGLPLRGRNQWPDGMPGLREDMVAYFHALGTMCDRMLPAFAVALDMPADFFAPFFANEAMPICGSCIIPRRRT